VAAIPGQMRSASEHFITFVAQNKRSFDEMWERAEIPERPGLMDFRDYWLRIHQGDDTVFAAAKRNNEIPAMKPE